MIIEARVSRASIALLLTVAVGILTGCAGGEEPVASTSDDVTEIDVVGGRVADTGASDDVAGSGVSDVTVAEVTGDDAGEDPANTPQKLCTEHADCVSSDLCQGTGYCNKGKDAWVCAFKQGSAVVCDAALDTVCTRNTCSPSTGTCAMKPAPAGTPCSDDDPCSVAATCEAGKCKAGSASWCECQVTEDCGAKEDGDLCNGTLFCDKSSFPFRCRVQNGTLVACDDTEDTTCSKSTCQPVTGKCKQTPLKDGVSCDDGQDNTVGDVCEAGLCKSGVDVNACTTTDDCEKLEDGDVCNGVLFCDQAEGVCKINPATIIKCPTVGNSDCAKTLCVPVTGQCVKGPVKNGSGCDDSDKCTSGEVCVVGVCKGGTNICKCAKDSDCAGKEDGNLCNGTLFCNVSNGTCEVNPATAKTCPSGLDAACLKNACVPLSGACSKTSADAVKKVGCVVGDSSKCRYEVRGPNDPLAKDIQCEDGDPCTTGELCNGASCEGGTFTCYCKSHQDCDASEDGDLCNGTLFCNKGVSPAECQLNPGTIVKCLGLLGKPCQENKCHPKTGACNPAPTNNAKACDDGSKCTVDDACKQGNCVGSDELNCDDGDACTIDTCSADDGCKHVAVQCGDGNACTTDKCSAATGKCAPQPVANGTFCNADSSSCTVNDACADGVCKAGVPVSCKLQTGACEKAICAPKGETNFECIAVPKTAGEACDDGDACTLGETCAAGKCTAGSKTALFKRTYAPADHPTGKLHLALTGVISKSSDASNGYAVAGVTWLGSAATPTAAGIWLAGLDLGGEVQWQLQDTVTKFQAAATKLPAGGAYPQLGAAGLIPMPGGKMAAVGTTVDGAGAQRIRLVVATNKGEKVRAVTLSGKPGSSDQALSVAAGAGGTAVVAGWRESKQKDGLAMQLTSAGTAAWQVQVGSETQDEQFRACDVSEVGDVLLAGIARNAANAEAGWLVRVSAAGKQAWARTYTDSKASAGGSGVKHRLTAVTWVAGGAVAAGVIEEDGKSRHWILKVEPKLGELVWHKESSTAFEVHTIARRGGDQLVLAGVSRPGPGASDVRLLAVDTFGNADWDLIGDDSVAEGATAVHGTVDGSVVVVGHTLTEKGVRGTVLRADPWGRHTCKSSGACFGKPLAACADKTGSAANPCTRDTCDPKLGCANAALPGRDCLSADGCSRGGVCTNGSCGPSDEGRLYSQLLDAGELKEVVQVEPDGDGAFVAARTIDGGLKLIRLDKYGALTGTTTVKASAGQTWAGAVPMFDGGYIAAWQTADKKAVAARFSADGKELWQTKVCEPFVPTTGDTHASCNSAQCNTENAKRWRDWIPNCDVREILSAAGGKSVVVGGTIAGERRKDNALQHNIEHKHCLWSRVLEVTDGKLKPMAAGGHYCGGLREYAWGGGWAVREVYGSRVLSGRTKLLPDGGLLAFGRVEFRTLTHPLDLSGPDFASGRGVGISRLTPQHVEGWTTELAGTSEDRIADVVQRNDGSFIAVGSKVVAAVTKDWIVALDGKGQLLWEQSGRIGTLARPTAVHIGAGGAIAVLADTISNSVKRIQLTLLTTEATVLTQRLLGPNGLAAASATLQPMARLDDLGVLVASAVTKSGKARLLAVRADAWGHDSCKGAGLCAAKTVEQCADGDACSPDLCNASKGCEKTAFSCNDGEPCTTDVCDKKLGCTHGDVPCDDKDACTVDTCEFGKGCVYTKVLCDDDNPCTTKACDKAKGCIYTNFKDGTHCPSCLQGMICKAGLCTVKDQVALSFCGITKMNPGQSCREILRMRPVGNGKYVIDPDGAGPLKAWNTYCDMAGGGWTRINEHTDYPYKSYGEGSSWHAYTYELNDAQIDALRSVSTEARQDWNCRSFGVSQAPSARWRDGTSSKLSEAVGCWAAGNDSLIRTGINESFAQIPVRAWESIDCDSNDGEKCVRNVGHAWLK